MTDSLKLRMHCILFFQQNPRAYIPFDDLFYQLGGDAAELEKAVNQLVTLSILEKIAEGGTLRYCYLCPQDTIYPAGGTKMNRSQIEHLEHKIEIIKKQLIETALQTNSLVDQSVVRKSQELDDLIVEYLRLSSWYQGRKRS
jgi:hypothetical protein